MRPGLRIFRAGVAFALTCCVTAAGPALGADPGSGAGLRLAQSVEERKRLRREEELRRRDRIRERWEERDRDIIERREQWREERRLRMERDREEREEQAEEERELQRRRLEREYERRRDETRGPPRLGRSPDELRALVDRFPAAWLAGILAGRVEKGWTAKAVRESWGEPDRIAFTPAGEPVWHYGDRRVVFFEGRVAEVEGAEETPASEPKP